MKQVGNLTVLTGGVTAQPKVQSPLEKKAITMRRKMGDLEAVLEKPWIEMGTSPSDHIDNIDNIKTSIRDFVNALADFYEEDSLRTKEREQEMRAEIRRLELEARKPKR